MSFVPLPQDTVPFRCRVSFVESCSEDIATRYVKDIHSLATSLPRPASTHASHGVHAFLIIKVLQRLELTGLLTAHRLARTLRECQGLSRVPPTPLLKLCCGHMGNLVYGTFAECLA